MVLTNQFLTGLVLLLVACIPQCPSEAHVKRSRSAEITTTTVRNGDVTDSQNAIVTTRRYRATTSEPKTDVSNDKISEQRSRGATKYADYATTEASKSTPYERVDENNGRATTPRNDRSLSVDDSADAKFHNENNIYAGTADGKYGSLNEEKRTTRKPWNEVGYADFRADLTTPRYDSFDGKHTKMQEEISRAIDQEMDDMSKSPVGMTTPSYDAYSKYRMEEPVSKTTGLTTHTYKELTGEVPKSPAGELTTPSNDVFDGHYKKIHEDISKSLDDSVDKFFDGKKDVRAEDNDEKPLTNNSKLDYVRYRSMEAIESKIKNKIHKDYNTESGLRMKVTSNYNNTKHTQPVDAPGIVINTIPGQKDLLESPKKSDLDNGETKLEKITIEKPEKDPGVFINNKIENELYSTRTEGPEERPFEHRGIFLSKRGSTVDNGETVQKTLSTESVIPLDLYPVKTSVLDRYSNNNIQNTTAVPKIAKKEKNKTVKKELENASSDLDNKIPKFLTPITTLKYHSAEATTAGSSTAKVVRDDELTTPIFESTTEMTSTDENGGTTEYFDTDVTTDTPEYSDVTDTSISDATIGEETTIYSEMTTENIEDVTKILKDGTTETQTITTVNLTGKNSESTSDTTPSYVPLSTTERSDTTWRNTVFEKVSETTSLPTSLSAELSPKSVPPKKNETVSNVVNEITKPPNLTTASSINETPTTKKLNLQSDTVSENPKENVTKVARNDQTKQNEINVISDKIVSDECENEETDDYGENNCKTHNVEEGAAAGGVEDPDLEENSSPSQRSATTENKNGVTGSVTSTLSFNFSSTTTPVIITTTTATSTTQKNREVTTTEEDAEATTKSDSIVGAEDEEENGGNGGKIAAIVISAIGGICLLLLVALLIIMKKRQKRFNYGQRCRPVSLDAYSMDNVSIHNSTRRKGVLMMSKRSYGNPAFEDPTSPTHLLHYGELLKFNNNQDGIRAEFDRIPQVTTKTNELPEGCDIKNRYANVIPLPETRVFLNIVEGIPSSDYINANYVTGPQGARNYYIACQAPMANTIEDFWRMIWEQQSKVILMLTHLYENGIEKCIDYLPPSEVLDCHRLFGDYQVTLKKREVKDKYIISSLQLKNMVSNSWREVTHLWYMGWPEKGVPDETNSLIAFLIEARSCMKTGDNKIKETSNTNISNGLTPNLSPVVVHCSPGTGRTGTVIACDIAVREFELTRKVDIPRIVYRVRRDRASAVQTKEQYAYIYKVINFYATKLTGGVFDSF